MRSGGVRVPRLALATAIVAALAVSPAGAPARDGRLPQDVFPRDYELTIAPHPATLTLDGRERIVIEVLAQRDERHVRGIALTTTEGLARGTAVRPVFRAYARTLLRPEFDRLGWDPKAGESFLDALLRPDLIAALGRFEDADIIAEARARFEKFTKDPASLAPDLREPVLEIVGHRADQVIYAKLGELGATATSTEEKLRYFGAMASAEDPKLIQETVVLAASGEIPNGRVAQMIGQASVKSDNPDEVWRQVLPRQKDLRAHLTEESQNYLLPAAAAGSTSTAIARALLADPSAKTSIGATIIAKRFADQILTQADLQQRAVPALTAWLAARK